MTGKQKKLERRQKKQGLLQFYIQGETNTSVGGIVYQKLKVSQAARPKKIHPDQLGAFLYSEWVLKLLLGPQDEG